MNIGIMYTGIGGANGADYVAQFLGNAVNILGHNLTMIGTFGSGIIPNDIPEGLDFVVHSSGFGLTPQSVEKFKKKSKIFLWTHNDDHYDIGCFWQNIINPITNIVDIHFSYTKKPLSNNSPNSVYLPIGADETIYYKKDLPKEFDMCLIGAPHQWRIDFFNLLKPFFPKSFINLQIGALSHGQCNDIYNKTKVVIAPLQDCDRGVPGRSWGCPCRTFDVPAAGAFQLHVKREGLLELLPNATYIEPILDMNENVKYWTEHINFWLNNEKERKEKAEEMYDEIMTKHLYKHRLQTIIEHFEKYN